MYRMPENAQPTSAGAERSVGDDGGFSDQQCGIAASQADAAVAGGRNRGEPEPKTARLLDQFQQWAATRRRFRVLQPFCGGVILHHRIA
jgi:hypothetical protein